VAAVRRRIAAEHLDGSVRLVEQTHDVPSYLQASDVFVLPSRREGLPNALLEAMAAGLPCIAADLPGITRWLLEDGESGWLVPPGDVEALERALVTLLEDRERAAQLGARARRRVEALCSIDAVAAAYLDIYTRLAATR
jgi:glycosyltransferase involved in cell wall biosynthesis